MKKIDLISKSWPDYELLDSGDNKKLERFGNIILIRPETQALWHQRNPNKWKNANAEFIFSGSRGIWKKNNLPDSWEISWEGVRCILKPTSFKHVGIFPEQEANWKWISERVSFLKSPRVLNIFGYTGVASIAAALVGAKVTHIDASKQSNDWAHKNADLSGVQDSGIRYITDDAIKFIEREVRRDSKYEGIILDPPAFGRGPKNEVWRIEEDFSRLLSSAKKLLSTYPGSFFLINGYAAGYSAHSFSQTVEEYFKINDGEYGELMIEESGSDRLLPSGIYVRWSV